MTNAINALKALSRKKKRIDGKNNQHHDLASPEFPPVDSSDLLPQANAIPTTAPGSRDPQPSHQLDFAHRRHRSGKVFCTLVAPRKPILKVSSVPSSPQNPQLLVCPPAQNKCDQNCCEKLSNKKLNFSSELSVRFITGNQFQDFTQNMLVHLILGQNSKTFLMLSAIGIESSKKELLYKAIWSSPNDTNSEIDTQID